MANPDENTMTPPSPDVVRDPDAPANRSGRTIIGLYPHLSRKKLAEHLGCDISNVSAVLSGRRRIMDMAVVFRLAEMIGIPADQLAADLKDRRDRFKAEQKRKRK